MAKKNKFSAVSGAADMSVPASVPPMADPVATVETETSVVALLADVVPVETNPLAEYPMQENLITQGVEDMTDTVNQTFDTTAVTDAATGFIADVQEKATEAADKGKQLAADAVEFSKANVEAMIEAGKIAATGVQDLGKANVEFAKQNFADMQAAAKEITSVKSPTDFMKLQSEFARKSFDVAVVQASKNTEAMVKLMSDMFQPVSNRVAVTTDLFKKAA